MARPSATPVATSDPTPPRPCAMRTAPRSAAGGERRQEGVDGPEVGQLDSQHAERHEGGREERRAPVGEAARDEVHDPHGDQVEQSRQGAADEVGAVVALLPEQGGHALGEHHRQAAVDEGALVVVVGIEARARGVEVLGEALRNRELLLHHGDETLVRMQVVAGIPPQALPPKHRADGQHRKENRARARAGESGQGRLNPPRRGVLSGSRKRPISSRLDSIHSSNRSTPSAGSTRGFHPRSPATRSMLQ